MMKNITIRKPILKIEQPWIVQIYHEFYTYHTNKIQIRGIDAIHGEKIVKAKLADNFLNKKNPDVYRDNFYLDTWEQLFHFFFLFISKYAVNQDSSWMLISNDFLSGSNFYLSLWRNCEEWSCRSSSFDRYYS